MGTSSTDPSLLVPMLIALAVGLALGAGLVMLLTRAGAGTGRASEAPPAQNSADDRFRAIAQLTGGLAHEIKNPLSTIGLNTRLLGEMIEDLELPAEEAGRLERRAKALAREVERLEGILSDFLEFAGDPRLDPTEEDLNDVVQEVTDFFEPQAQQRGVRLRVQLHGSSLRASVDEPHLKQAILNLMLNAVQAMATTDGGGDLIVRTSEERSGSSVHVTDTGPGMDTETLGRVFDPYFTTKAGGSGLGLPITRKLIEAMGGTLEVHSEPGKGTDVMMWFPRVQTRAVPST